MKAVLVLATLMAAEMANAANGQFTWDVRWDPESANNMCYSMYCLGRGETVTYNGGKRTDNGDESGQLVHPVANHVAYNLVFPRLQNTISILVAGVMQWITQRLIVADEWPPATALEGGQGASLRPTTRQDGYGQGPRIKQMWAARDATTNRVQITPINNFWTDGFHIVDAPYCRCKNLSGAALRICCNNDGFQFQKDPDPANPPPNGKDAFFFNNLDNFIRPKPGPFKALAVDNEERAVVTGRNVTQEDEPASLEGRTAVEWAA